MPVFPRPHTILACALAAAGCAAAAPAQAAWIYARLQPVSQTTDHSGEVSLSNDGKTVVFVSAATQWVDGTPPAAEVYAYDMDRSVVEAVSVTSGGDFTSGRFPSVSRSGRHVAYLSFGGLYEGGSLAGWQVVRKDRETGLLQLVTSTSAGLMLESNANQDDATAISGDGRYVAFVSSSPSLGVATEQVFRKDMQTGAVALVSVNTNTGNPAPGNSAIRPHAVSEDGRYIVFKSPDPLVPGVTATGQIYLRDMVANTTELVSRQSGAGGAPSTTSVDHPAISPNGRYVLFKAYFGLGAPPNYSGVYLRDRLTHTSTSIPTPAATPAGSACFGGDVADNGLVIIQCGSAGQAFLWAPGAPNGPELVSYNPSENPGNGSSGNTLGIDAAGLSMVFDSAASDLDPADTNQRNDMFVHIDSSVLYGIFSDSFED